MLYTDFYATWCQGCQSIYPDLCKLARDPQYAHRVRFVKVCVEELKTFTKDIGVKAMPYVQLYRPGNRQALVGFQAVPSRCVCGGSVYMYTHHTGVTYCMYMVSLLFYVGGLSGGRGCGVAPPSPCVVQKCTATNNHTIHTAHLPTPPRVHNRVKAIRTNVDTVLNAPPQGKYFRLDPNGMIQMMWRVFWVLRVVCEGVCMYMYVVWGFIYVYIVCGGGMYV